MTLDRIMNVQLSAHFSAHALAVLEPDPDLERAALEAHLAECAGCREQAEAEKGLRTRLRELPTPDLPQTTRSRRPSPPPSSSPFRPRHRWAS